MKRIVRQQNYLKELIEAQENKTISFEALESIVRAVLEPLLETPEKGTVLYRINSLKSMSGLLTRLEYSEIENIDYSDEKGNIKEKVWTNTEFVAVLTHRFVGIILWRTVKPSCEVKYYSILNSRLQEEFLDIVDRNSIVELKQIREKYKPERRENTLLNKSVRKIINNLNNSSSDMILGFAQEQTLTNKVFNNKDDQMRIRAISHDIKNQLSICDLYTEIIKKYCEKNNFNAPIINQAIESITRAISMSTNSLYDLKNFNKTELSVQNIKDTLNEAYHLTKVYAECKNVKYNFENNIEAQIELDKNKFLSVIINIIKNASEAFEKTNCHKNGKYIELKTEKNENEFSIKISNNAGKIKDSTRIFLQDYTTKINGSGIGLWTCRENISELNGELELTQNTEEVVEFTIKFKTKKGN